MIDYIPIRSRSHIDNKKIIKQINKKSEIDNKINKNISTVFAVVSVLFLLWFCASIVEIQMHNLDLGYEYNKFNMIKILLNIASYIVN